MNSSREVTPSLRLMFVLCFLAVATLMYARAARNTSEPAIHTMRLRASSVRSPISGTSTTAASFRPAASVAPIGSCRPR